MYYRAVCGYQDGVAQHNPQRETGVFCVMSQFVVFRNVDLLEVAIGASRQLCQIFATSAN